MRCCGSCISIKNLWGCKELLEVVSFACFPWKGQSVRGSSNTLLSWKWKLEIRFNEHTTVSLPTAVFGSPSFSQPAWPHLRSTWIFWIFSSPFMKGPAVRMTNIRLNSCRHSRAGLCGWESHQVYGLWEWITPDMPAISRGDGSLMVFQICLELFSNLELQRLQLKWPGADLIVSLAVSQGGHRSFGGAACSKWVIWREEKQFGQDVAKGVSLPGLLNPSFLKFLRLFPVNVMAAKPDIPSPSWWSDNALMNFGCTSWIVIARTLSTKFLFLYHSQESPRGGQNFLWAFWSPYFVKGEKFACFVRICDLVLHELKEH